MNNRKILISGSGIAGPTLAYWLLQHGFEPTLVERAPHLREGGYIIDFWGRGFDVAEKMGLLKSLKACGYAIDEVRFVNEQGERIGGLTSRAFQALVGKRYLSILRSDLSRLVYESLRGRARTIFDDTITAIAQNDDEVRVTFKRSAPECFDLVIGAGGLHSPVRELVFGPEAHYEKYLGYYAASFTVDGYPHRDPQAYVAYAAPGRQISRYSLRDDRTVFFLVFSERIRLLADRHDISAQKQILRDVFGRDKWECAGILEALDSVSDLYFDSVSQIRMDVWSHRRVALTGDACFCPSLLAGQGSALAMTAAYILAGELKEADGDYQTAFRNYENLFWPFVIRKQRAAKRFSRSFAPRTRFGIFARNQVTRLASLPFVANLAMGRLISDPLELPTYNIR